MWISINVHVHAYSALASKATGYPLAFVAAKVEINYKASLLDGTVFESSLDKDKPLTQAVAHAVKGWSEGLQLMSAGAKYKFYIPGKIAYGLRGKNGKVAPMETIVYEVELFNIIKKKDRKKSNNKSKK